MVDPTPSSSSWTEPTAHSDPQAYLCMKKFNRRLRRCPRTNQSVTYSDIGDPNGVPCVYLLPSGCSRWIAAPLDPLANLYGVRLIVVDRPGCGGTGEIPLGERIERSCEMIVSVLESLNVKPAHILASSAGIYYTLELLTRHPSSFLTSLNPPPRVYLIAPWSPLLEPDHPEFWPFKWNWIPTPLIATQHITTPQLIKAAQVAQTAWTTGTKALENGTTFAKKWFKSILDDEPWSSPAFTTSSSSSLASTTSTTPINGSGNSADISIIPTQTVAHHPNEDSKAGLGEGTEAPVPAIDGEDDNINEDEQGSASRKGRLWGPCPCCVACLTTDYMQAENGQGVGQEHLICLNRGPQNTGAQWLQTATDDLAATIDFAQTSKVRNRPLESNGDATDGLVKDLEYPLQVHVWWGWQDDMVPRKGQLWFNKVLGSHPGTINLTIHDVPDGDHTDLLARQEGIHQVFTMIQAQGHNTERLPSPPSPSNSSDTEA